MEIDLRKILIIGKLPPPIGGVTGYNKRLITSLKKQKFGYLVLDLKNKKIKNFTFIFKSKVIHLSLSNTYIKFLLVLILKLFFKKVITTLHGSYGRFSSFKNHLELLIIRLSDKTFLLNKASYLKLEKYKTKIILSSTNFEIEKEDLSERLKKNIAIKTNNYNKIFCTNSWKLTFDKHGKEIYSISKLVKVFEKSPNYFLIISDPSGTNEKYILDQLKISISENILFITDAHPFTEILKLSDGFIRATTTDGDALSVREAIILGIPVFASNVIDRPKECVLFNVESINSLIEKLDSIDDYIVTHTNREKKILIDDIIEVYNSLA